MEDVMLILEINGSKKLSIEQTETIKKIGEVIGYDDTRRIVVKNSNDLTQDDILYVKIFVKRLDYVKESFKEFCSVVATYLQYQFSVSVKVIISTIDDSIWFPTDEGVEIFGPDN